MSRRRNFARTLTAAFLLAVAAALLLLPSAPGHAQTTTNTYVSNIDQGQDEDWSTTLKRAQSFTTGSQSGGYTLTSVDIVSEDQNAAEFSAAIWTVDSDNEPDDGDNNNKVADLTAPGSFAAGTLNFTAPASITLDASTTYVVLITPTVESASLKFDTTDSNNEDANGADGWSIGTAAHSWSPGGNWKTLSSGEAIRIAIKGTTAAANNAATGAPVITGTAQVGQTLTAVTSGIMDADGLTSPGYTYQWIRVDGSTESDISGATSSTYTLVDADEGKTIKVKVSFTDDGSNDETLTSAATTAVANAQTTTNTYVSNIDQGNDNDWSASEDRAQTFTPGSQSGGYTVTSVDVGYDDDEGDKFSAAIWKVTSVNSVDVPDTGTSASKVADLTAPTGTWSAGDTLTFTAPTGTTLDASATYAVVFTSTGNAVKFDTTTSDGEDSGAFSGWSIADTGYFYNNNTWTANPGGEALRIAIKGTTAAAAAAVAWNATLTSADNWAVGSTYTYDGYGSSAADYLTTTHGSLSPGSFTVGGTTHTVELLGVRGGTESRLYLLTDTGVAKSDLAGYAMEFTVDGSTTTLKVSDATNAVVSTTNVGIYWAESRHSFGSDDWQAKTITVKLLLTAPGAPTGLTVTEGHHAVKLDWTAPADDGGSAITEYAVGVWVGGTWLTLADKPTGTSYTYDGSDESYRLRVRAINANGNGDWSTVVMGSTWAVLNTAPIPVVTPHPIRASRSRGTSSSTFTTACSWTSICSAKEETWANWLTGAPPWLSRGASPGARTTSVWVQSTGRLPSGSLRSARRRPIGR